MEAYWHYYIIDNRVNAGNLKIEADGKDVFFKKLELVSLSNGQDAYRISSLNNESIEESDDLYGFSLNLVDYSIEPTRVLTKLPFPSPDHLQIDNSGKNHISVYVYL